jgi:hypothetical protein
MADTSISRKLLKDAFVEIILGGLVDEELWKALREGAFAALVLVVRLILLAIFPISVPLVAWMVIHDRERREKQQAEFRIRVRQEMHQNGPAAPSHTTNKEK